MRMLERSPRRLLIFCHDMLAAAIAFPAALALRLGGDFARYLDWPTFAQAWFIFVAVGLGVSLATRLDRVSWRYASIDDAILIARISVIANLIFLLALFIVFRAEQIPRSVVVINMFVYAALLAGPRLLYRAWRDGQFRTLLLERGSHWRVPVLIVGAGDQAEAFQREMLRDPRAPYRVVGIVDDDPARIGTTIRGVRVLGPIDELPAIVEKLARRGARPERLVLSADLKPRPDLRRLLKLASDLGLRLDRLPAQSALRKADGSAFEVRPVDVEDLLSRPQANLDRAAMKKLLAGRRVLVTGAGGSIGSELVRQIAQYEPAAIALAEQCEFNLYEIDRSLAALAPEVPREALLCNVREAGRVDRIFARFRPEVVFHAAALKHVPLLEPQPCEAVLTNVVGSRHVADACMRHGARVMVMISTDKASDPVSVMGASKRVAESYAQALDMAARDRGGADGAAAPTRFVTVRFGNVLGSAGSVVPLFQEQLARGGPITVTHPDMVRYFMTIREAVQLVLFASAMESGERRHTGAIVVLDMGEPVRIIDMARQMIRLAGLEPDVDIRIEITGVRPGEKLSEQLFDARDRLTESGHPGLMIAQPAIAPLPRVAADLDRLEALARAGDEAATRALLMELAGARNAAERAVG